jgi:hypothetical protein
MSQDAVTGAGKAIPSSSTRRLMANLNPSTGPAVRAGHPPLFLFSESRPRGIHSGHEAGSSILWSPGPTWLGPSHAWVGRGRGDAEPLRHGGARVPSWGNSTLTQYSSHWLGLGTSKLGSAYFAYWFFKCILVHYIALLVLHLCILSWEYSESQKVNYVFHIAISQLTGM